MAEARLTAVVSTRGAKQSTSDLNRFTRSAANSDRQVKALTRDVDRAKTGFRDFGRNASAAAAAINGPLGGISSRISAIVTVITSGTAAITALAVAVTGFGFAVSKGVFELDKLNVASAKTEAILKATGGAVGLTTEQLNENARAIALNTLASVEGIQQAQAILLTFNRVQGETSERALELAQDMSSVFGGTAASNATKLGKALQDPVKGITALAITGVTFTQVQKDQIKLFQQTGEAAKAQQIILDELTNQVGGAGGAVASGTLAGAFDTAGQLFSEFTAKLAESTGAYDATLSFVDKLNRGLTSVTGLLSNDPLKNLTTDVDRQQRIADLTAQILEEKKKIRVIDKESNASTGFSYGGTSRSTQQSSDFSYQGNANSEKIVSNLTEELDLINKAIAAEKEQIEKRRAASAASSEIAKKQKEDDLDAVKSVLDAKEKKSFESAKRIADKELLLILASNDSELQAVNRKEEDKLALFKSYRDRDLLSIEEYEAAKAEIELSAKDRRAEIREEERQKVNAQIEEDNANVQAQADLAASAISDGFLEFAKGQKSAKDATLDVIGSVSDAIVKSIAEQFLQQKITDGLISAGFLKAKVAESATATAQAGQNALVSTAGAPYPLNLGAPAAAAAASAAAGALGAGVVAAASAREQGGSLAAGQSSTVAERGQLEILTPASNSRVRTAQQMKGIMGESGGGSPQFNIVVIDQSPGAKDVEASADDDGRIVLLIRETVAGDAGNANSQIRKSFAASTNLQSAGR